MKKTAEQLIAAFATGKMPKGEEFADLIRAAYNVPDIEVYDKNRIVSAPFKMLVDKTVVTTEQGDFAIDYSHIGFNEILFHQATPLHEVVVVNNINNLMSATITTFDLNGAIGKAFQAGDSPDGETTGYYRNAFGKPGDIIQYLIIGR